MKKEFNEKKISPISTAINLFDFANKEIDLRGWFYDLLRLFEEVDLVPTMIEVVRDGPDIDVTRILVKNALKRFEAANFKGYRGFLIYATPSSDVRNPFKWLMTTRLNLDKDREMFSLDFDSELIPFTKDKIGALFKRLEGYCGARYGYSMQRPFAYAGSSYAYGGGYNLDEYHRDPLKRQFAMCAVDNRGKEKKMVT